MSWNPESCTVALIYLVHTWLILTTVSISYTVSRWRSLYPFRVSLGLEVIIIHHFVTVTGDTNLPLYQDWYSASVKPINLIFVEMLRTLNSPGKSEPRLWRCRKIWERSLNSYMLTTVKSHVVMLTIVISDLRHKTEEGEWARWVNSVDLTLWIPTAQ